MKLPMKTAQLARDRQVRTALQQSPALRAALARLRPADRSLAGKAIGDAIVARLPRAGGSR